MHTDQYASAMHFPLLENLQLVQNQFVCAITIIYLMNLRKLYKKENDYLTKFHLDFSFDESRSDFGFQG